MATARDTKRTKILQILVVLQFLAIVTINFTKSYSFLDRDSALAVRHAVEMWNNGLFLKDFNYFSTMEIDNSAFLATPIYAMTQNLSLSLGIGHLFTYILMVAILFDIFKKLKISKESFLLAVLMIYTPYAVGQLQWTNMLFLSVGQYEFRVISMLLLIDIFMMCDMNECKNYKFLSMLVVYYILSFWTALSSGNYVLLMIVIPCMFKIFIDIFFEKRIKLRSAKNCVLLGAIITAVLGWRLHVFYAGSSFRNDLPLISAQEFFLNIQNCIAGIYLLFGAIGRETDISIFTMNGICTILRFIFANGCLMIVAKELLSVRRENVLRRYFIAFLTIHLGVLFIAKTQYGSLVFEERYHILWGVLLLVFTAVLILQEEYYMNLWVRNFIVYATIFTLVILNGTGYAHLMKRDNNRPYEMAIIKKAKQLNVDSIYLYNDSTTAVIIRAMEPSLYCISTSIHDNQIVMDSEDFYKNYGDNFNASEKNLLVCYKNDFDLMPEYIRTSYKSVDLLEDKVIYVSDKNPWDGMSGLPPKSIKETLDYPYSNGYVYNGEIDGEGSLRMGEQAEDGVVFCGPYTVTEEGTYDIELLYDVEVGEDEIGWVEVVIDDNIIVAKQNLLMHGKSALLEKVKIPSNRIFEIRLWKTKNAVITLDELQYRRLSEDA